MENSFAKDNLEINSFDQNFYNPETELNDKYLNEITMHKITRNKCFDIIIQGLIFKTDAEYKEFTKFIASKFGIGGCYKIVKEYDEVNKVFIFKGDKRDAIKDVLIEKYGKDDEFIKYVG